MLGLGLRGSSLGRAARPAACACRRALSTVNSFDLADRIPPPPRASYDTACGEVSGAHWEQQWAAADVQAASMDNCMFTWGPSDPARAGAPLISRAEGVYLYDGDGKQYLDWTSQAVCTNLGYTVPQQVQDAVGRQLRDLPFVYSGLAMTEPRARLSKLLAELIPGDINGFIFPSSGAEANEGAIRMARRFTGRQKIMTRYRSYHGGTTAALTATGDFRRWFAEQGHAGYVKIVDPNPFGYQWADNEEEAGERALAALHEQILMEGPQTIAAFLLEHIPGSGGVLLPPKGYMEGVQALCKEYGILLIADEARSIPPTPLAPRRRATPTAP